MRLYPDLDDVVSQGSLAVESGRRLEEQVGADLRRQLEREGVPYQHYRNSAATEFFAAWRINHTKVLTEILLEQVHTGAISVIGKEMCSDLFAISPDGITHVVELHRQTVSGSAEQKLFAKLFNLLAVEADERILVMDGRLARSDTRTLVETVIENTASCLTDEGKDRLWSIKVMTPQEYVAWYAELTYPY